MTTLLQHITERIAILPTESIWARRALSRCNGEAAQVHRKPALVARERLRYSFDPLKSIA